jgi:membrane-associated phospholipid phosphatase
LATSDGLLRIVGDRHYATDVLAGAAIGFGFGYGMPTLLHYGVTRPGSLSSSDWVLSPMVGSRTGLVFGGSF